MDGQLESRVVGALLAITAVLFWYEAPTWARERTGRHGPFRRTERLMERPAPDPRTVRMNLIALRLVAVACFVTGALQVVA